MTPTMTPPHSHPTGTQRPTPWARQIRIFAIAGLMVGTLAGCNTLQRLSEVGGGPKVSAIQNPVTAPDYQPVSMPMPTPVTPPNNPNSLWRAGARAFFKDLRAKDVGDIVTVVLELDDSAELENTTERERDDSEDTDLPALAGFETKLDNFLPDAVDPTNLIEYSNQHETTGEGDIDRSEVINLTMAAVVTQVLPNGNLVVMGRQEVAVNAELREIMVTGVIRPGDIDPDNQISHDKIAEMRVAYGGRGTLSELQQPRWGVQVWDILFPF